ncbi:MAG TPA: type II secretion system F family protein [Pirellulales bacterium]
MDPQTLMIAGAAFVMVVVLAIVVGMLLVPGDNKVDARIGELSGKPMGASTHGNLDYQRENARKLAQAKQFDKITDVMTNKEERTQLQQRLREAGFYDPTSLSVYLAVRMIITIAPPVLGVLVSMMGYGMYPLLGGIAGGMVGMIGPSMWLDRRKKERQMALRRGLPDAMDVLVICMEGGLSLPASLARVATELKVAHLALASELGITQKEIQLGKTTGEALKSFSERTDMEEVRSLAGVIQQAEKYGSSLAGALRIHAETLRLKRAQKAEEMAHQAATKMLFPTLLFIFPSIFLVILGPAVIKILATFKEMNN